MYLIKMAYIKTAYESHRQCTLIRLIFDDVIKPLDPKQLKIAWYVRMTQSKNFKIIILASKQGKGGKSVLLFFLFSLFSQNQENLLSCYQAIYKSRKSVLQNQENLFSTLTLCYSAQIHVLLLWVNLLSMLYNIIFPTITINTN